MQDVSEITGEYNTYLQRVAQYLENNPRTLATLADLIDDAHAVHIFGFGRSGTAALAMAIRLRHFLSPGKEVSWLGDQVRTPIRERDLVILFSGSGDRKEVISFLDLAHEKKARTVAITMNEYGGGDFEMSAWFFQEVFLTYYGNSRRIPKDKVGHNHI
ncbi:MAG: 3-hexulose-6-phosphate isomerase [Methanoregulaceae archaeon PtaU1.Bin222]|nr:MAG: 3-hexulose-6-phosphate isomerase [Methanoregulaceae archaeon PtaU1.Bin222]